MVWSGIKEGQTKAEYALILGGIAIVVILAIVFLGAASLFRATGQLDHEPGLMADRRVRPEV